MGKWILSRLSQRLKNNDICSEWDAFNIDRLALLCVCRIAGRRECLYNNGPVNDQVWRKGAVHWWLELPKYMKAATATNGKWRLCHTDWTQQCKSRWGRKQKHASGDCSERQAATAPRRVNAVMLVWVSPQWKIHANGDCAERQAAVVPHRLHAVKLVRMRPQR